MLLLILPVLFTGCLCQDSVFGDYTVFAADLFVASDKNGDGLFTKPDFETLITSYDLNGDNITVRAEYVLWIQQAHIGLDKFAGVVFDIYDACTKDDLIDSRDTTCYIRALDSMPYDNTITLDEWMMHWVELLKAHEHLHTGLGP